jgi:hypothetical protein
MADPCACKRYRTDGRHVARYDPAQDCRACWEAATIRKANLAAGGDGRVLPVGDLGAAPPPKGAVATAKAAARFPRPLPCVHLGRKAYPDCGCADRVCDAGRGVVKRFVECQTCDGYAAKPS